MLKLIIFFDNTTKIIFKSGFRTSLLLRIEKAIVLYKTWGHIIGKCPKVPKIYTLLSLAFAYV